MVSQGTGEAEVAGFNRQSSVDDIITGPKFNEPIDVDVEVTETPEVAVGDDNVFLTKLRNAIRYIKQAKSM